MACSICIPANEGFGAGPLDEDAGCGAGGIDGGGIDAGGGVAICCYIWLDDRSNRQKRMLVRPGESRWESYLSLALNCTRPCREPKGIRYFGVVPSLEGEDGMVSQQGTG